MTKKAKDYCQIVVQTGCVMLKPFFNKVQLKRRHINCYEYSRYTSNEKTNKQKCPCGLSEFIRVKQGYVTVLTRCIWCMCSLFALKGV